MRVATFNVNSIGARLELLQAWLNDRKPDIACLQELKVTTENFPYQALAAVGYHACVHGQKGWNGVAVLSREPLQLVSTGLPRAEEAGARLLTARAGDLLIASVYVPNGKSVDHPDFPTKLAFLERLREHLRETIDLRGRVIVGGDFNVAHRDLDSCADPTVELDSLFHTAAERRAIDALLDAGLCDLYRDLHPVQRSYSWWDYRAGSFHKNLGLRIDLLLASRSVREQVTEVWIDRDYRKKKDGNTPSDHAPVIADIG